MERIVWEAVQSTMARIHYLHNTVCHTPFMNYFFTCCVLYPIPNIICHGLQTPQKKLLFRSKVQISKCSNVSKCCRDKNPESEDAGCDRLSVDSFSSFCLVYFVSYIPPGSSTRLIGCDKPHWDSISRQGEHYEYSKALDLIWGFAHGKAV